jgi:hypothetical protein
MCCTPFAKECLCKLSIEGGVGGFSQREPSDRNRGDGVEDEWLRNGQSRLGDHHGRETISKQSLHQTGNTRERSPDRNAHADSVGVDYVRGRKAHHNEHEHVDHREEIDVEEG